MGEVVHQAGMEQRSGFEPPLSVWRTDVLPLHKRCEFCGDTVGGAPVRMATDLHSGLARRQPLPRRFRIYKFRLGFSPHTPAPEPTTELCIPAPVHRSHPLSFIGPETGKSQLSRPAAYAQRTGKTTFAGLRSVRLRGKRSRLWCRRQDSNLRLSELALYATIRPSSTAEVRLHEGGCSSFRAASQSCDGAQALLRQQGFKRSQTHLLEGELNGLAFGHVSMCPQLQHRGLRGLLQDFASPIRLFR